MPALVSGTPVGTLTSAEEIYLESSPTIYFQDYNAGLLYNPDSDGFYWGLTGTTTYPVYELGCVTNVSLTENLTVNDVLCDNVGVKGTVQQRNYVEVQFTLQSLFPFQTLRHVLKGGAVTESGGALQKFGIGPINNNQYWHLYAPKVYDEDVGDLVIWNFHKGQFVNAFTINTPFGSPWQVTGVVFRFFADTTKPAGQRFGSLIRSDLSAVA